MTTLVLWTLLANLCLALANLTLSLSRLLARAAGFWMDATDRAEKRIDTALAKAKARSP